MNTEPTWVDLGPGRDGELENRTTLHLYEPPVEDSQVPVVLVEDKADGARVGLLKEQFLALVQFGLEHGFVTPKELREVGDKVRQGRAP